MKKAASIALTQCLGVRKKDSVLIVTDKKKKKIAEAFFYEAIPLAKHVLLITIPIGKIHGEEPPKLVADVMKKYDVGIFVTTMSLSHTNARKIACKKGARIASMPGITVDMMKRCLPVDYAKMTELNKKILKKTKKLTADHYIPLIKGGNNSIDNIIPACIKCNKEKFIKDPSHFKFTAKTQMIMSGLDSI